MHILIAPDSFKESLSALDAAKAIQRGLKKALPNATFDLMPIGDGGEGTLETLTDGLHLRRDSHIVTGALGQPVEAHYATNGQLAVFEMADICGLEKVPLDKRNPLTLTTKGVGEMIGHLVDLGTKEIMIGVGGSSTNDGGIGMAAGLGYRFFDESGQEVAAVGDNLGNITTISYEDYHWDLSQVELTIITDVTNPLCGPNGATYVFGGQKGLANEKFASVDKDTLADAQTVAQRSAMRYDREGDDHYDIASALMKSMRGSDPDAALHYLARLLEAGDMTTAIRRILCSASEDVGMAYPQAALIVKACVDNALQLGLPEARLPLAQAVVLLATAPKSNSVYEAIAAAQADVRAGKTGDYPRHLQNVHADSAGMEREQGYLYPHDFPRHWVRQQYLPDLLADRHYYRYGDNKNEQAARRYWDEIKGPEA